MKKNILQILRTGVSRSKEPLERYYKYFYFFKYLIQREGDLTITRRNDFWSFANKQNRLELINDIYKVRRFTMTDDAYFSIINRFENGDAYGIVKA